MKKYRVTLQHDKGKQIVIVSASSIFAAREMVKKFENCPDRAILAISKVGAK